MRTKSLGLAHVLQYAGTTSEALQQQAAGCDRLLIAVPL